MKVWSQCSICSVVIMLVLGAARTTDAQVSATTGAIVGTVTDNSKAVMPGVSITAGGPALMGARTAVTDAQGAYRIPTLPPGVYQLVFEIAGFGTVTRTGIQIAVGFTATVNAEMNLAGVAENVTVNGASPVIDVTSTKVATEYNAEKLEALPGSRDYASVTSFLPGVSQSRPSVGGTGSVTYQRSQRYGLVGHDRGEVEGIVTTEAAAGGQEVAYSDATSFDDMVMNVLGNGADMPNPGTLTKVVSKSGSNQYRGRMYLDYQDHNMEGHNIDAAQLALGLKTVGTVPIQDSNRTIEFRDFSGDLGGYLVKDKLWWYGAYRRELQSQNELTLLDDIHELQLHVRTLKADFSPKSGHKFNAYWFRGTKHQNHSILANLSDTAVVTGDALQSQIWPNGVGKFEYDAILGSSAVLELRGGQFFEEGITAGVGTEPRYQDPAANRNYGNAGAGHSNHHRPQGNGTFTYFKDGWAGSHSFKVGGELMNDFYFGTTAAYNNITLILNNGAPSQVRLYDPPNDANVDTGTWAWGAFLQDGWKVNSRITLNLGLRVDWNRSYVPAQTGPTGQQFQAFNSPSFLLPGPRVGIVYALTKDQKTILKASYGQYFTYPYNDFASLLNPLPNQSSRLFTWTPANPTYVNGLPVYVPGQEGALISTSRARADGQPATRIDPNIQAEYSQQTSVYVERELAADFGIRTGFVWNGLRSGRQTINANQPVGAFTVPVNIQDPGPDGIVGTADDGPVVRASNLDAAHLSLPVDQVYTNVPYTEADFYTWEIQTSRRQKGRWSLQTSFTNTWNRSGAERALPYITLQPVTPNALIGTDNGRNIFTNWAAKLQASIDVWSGLRVSPSFRMQSGPPFARTFIARLNYNSAVTILAEPIGAERMPMSSLFDVRTEKTFKWDRSRVGLFFDVYNIFNNNATQELTRSSGPLFLRPSVITAPRVARVGFKFNL
jgi:carboxypeptidase family protein/TonB-dependent receptor-like protein